MSIPATLLPFLTTQGSLTTLLERHARQPLRVVQLGERYQIMDLPTKQQLGLPPRPALAWVREVALYGNDDTAWVHAKSIFPLPYLTAEAKRLRHLKRTPIGYVMFKKNQCLPHKRTIFCQMHNGQKRWGRQTVYDWRGRQFLIEEIFLTNFE